MKGWLQWDEKRMKVKKMETVVSTSFHVNRKQRDWMMVDIFSFKMCDTRCICMPERMIQ